jgi:outer membrane lipoprotein-sorting protein
MQVKFKLRLVLILVMPGFMITAADFKSAKKKLNTADCSYFEFLTTIESQIFDVIDSAYGQAYIARDGRYVIRLGPDVYLFDGDTLYTYFWENNQVIIESPDSSDLVASEISFVVKLDEWYDSKPVKQKNSWQLNKKKDVEGDIPDSMIITVDPENSDIKNIEYFDINEDLNRIQIIKQKTDSLCSDKEFLPEFPDSVERVRL